MSPQDLLLHAQIALTHHARWCRSTGHPFPPLFSALLESLADSHGQSRPILDDAPAPPDAALMLTYNEAAQALRVSPRTVRRMVADGRLAVVEMGGCKRIRRADVEAIA